LRLKEPFVGLSIDTELAGPALGAVVFLQFSWPDMPHQLTALLAAWMAVRAER
jgi:hypothetical protein